MSDTYFFSSSSSCVKARC